MRLQLLPGLIFSGSDIKTKIRPGIEARWCTIEFLMSVFTLHSYVVIYIMQFRKVGMGQLEKFS